MKKLILSIALILCLCGIAAADELAWYNYTFGGCRLDFQKTAFSVPETGVVTMYCGAVITQYQYMHVSPIITIYIPTAYPFVRAIDGSLYSLAPGYWVWAAQYKPD